MKGMHVVFLCREIAMDGMMLSISLQDDPPSSERNSGCIVE